MTTIPSLYYHSSIFTILYYQILIIHLFIFNNVLINFFTIIFLYKKKLQIESINNNSNDNLEQIKSNYVGVAPGTGAEPSDSNLTHRFPPLVVLTWHPHPNPAILCLLSIPFFSLFTSLSRAPFLSLLLRQSYFCNFLYSHSVIHFPQNNKKIIIIEISQSSINSPFSPNLKCIVILQFIAASFRSSL